MEDFINKILKYYNYIMKLLNKLFMYFNPGVKILQDFEYNYLIQVKKSKEDWQKLAEDNLIGWSKATKSLDKAHEEWEKAVKLANEINNLKIEILNICENQKEFIEAQSKTRTSLEKTIDSLIGELIIRGVTEDEIKEMFHDKIGSASYNVIMYELYENK